MVNPKTVVSLIPGRNVGNSVVGVQTGPLSFFEPEPWKFGHGHQKLTPSHQHFPLANSHSSLFVSCQSAVAWLSCE